MGKVTYVTATGRFKEWSRFGIPPSYDDTIHTLRDEPECPPDGTFWNGSAWVALPAPNNAEKNAILDALLSTLEGKAVLSVVNVLIAKNVITKAEVAAEWRSLS